MDATHFFINYAMKGTECIVKYISHYTLVKVVADKVCQEEIMQVCHDGNGGSQQSWVPSGNFGGEQWGQWYC